MPEKLRVEWEESLAFCASPSCENKNRQTALILLHDFSFPALAKDWQEQDRPRAIYPWGWARRHDLTIVPTSGDSHGELDVWSVTAAQWGDDRFLAGSAGILFALHWWFTRMQLQWAW